MHQMSALDSPNFTVRATWARPGESPEWIAERMDVLLRKLKASLNVADWVPPGGRAWSGDVDEEATLLRATASPTAVEENGYHLTAFAANPALHIVASVSAGNPRVGRRNPTHHALLDVKPTGPGAVSSQHADDMIAAMVEAWAPLDVTLSSTSVFPLEKRGGWQISSGHRVWLADEAASVTRAAEGITACRLHGGTMLSLPDDWETQQVVDAMARTRDLNGLDLVAH